VGTRGVPVSDLTQASAVGGHASIRDAPGRRYLGRYLLLGAVTSVLASISALVYLVATPPRPDRGLLYVSVSLGIVLGALCALVVRRCVGTRWETTAFLVWSVATILLIYGAAQVDGGAESPIGWLLILPVVYASINYPVWATGVMATGALLAALGLMLFANDWSGADWFRVLFIITFDVMALSSAINRQAYAIAEQQLTIVAMHDGLTGCLNNAAFRERLGVEEARARRSGRSFSLVMCDADNFKTINDTLGHDVGDETLRAFGRLLMNAARAGDDVARIGGDEFSIILTDTDGAQAQAVARRLHDALRAATLPARATLSLGMATWLGGDESSMATLQRADEAMYEAKRLGGDRVVVASATCAAPVARTNLAPDLN
jgi:diguanylate cyclase (GGDEF)-like protein